MCHQARNLKYRGLVRPRGIVCHILRFVLDRCGYACCCLLRVEGLSPCTVVPITGAMLTLGTSFDARHTDAG
ncbi:hypothetical protein SAMN05216228_1021104 [Rhizobium tibeticum]|uniref:Uncharacterized protein n=1 Tax=Rhizobium tibeticum TaxID=501024 RepID=A0A1H8RH37_9HYPH|nr:hypothetical protein RTCCBAU85039_4181 [Rhizobium tibeticum]SEO65577.1 hypothetical protein SAMN05216228_1021104 [Rhizobium tibeticum]